MVPVGEPSKSMRLTSSMPNIVLKCPRGLAIVAEQETNWTCLLPRAAHMRLSLLIMNAM